MPQSLQETYAPNNRCFGCGPANEKGLRIKSFVEGDEVVAEWRPEPHHQAFDGILNGGICGALLDCHSNWAATHHLMKQSGAATPPCTVTADFHVTLPPPDAHGRAAEAPGARRRIVGRPRRRRGLARGQRQGHGHVPRDVRRGQGRSPGVPPMVNGPRRDRARRFLLLAAASAARRAARSRRTTVISGNRARVYYLYAPASVSAGPAGAADRHVPRLGARRQDARRRLEGPRGEGGHRRSPARTRPTRCTGPRPRTGRCCCATSWTRSRRSVRSTRAASTSSATRRARCSRLQMACLESEYFAAAAVHAVSVDPAYFSIFDFAARKIPIAIFIGTRDAYFPHRGRPGDGGGPQVAGIPRDADRDPGHTHDYSAKRRTSTRRSGSSCRADARRAAYPEVRRSR